VVEIVVTLVILGTPLQGIVATVVNQVTLGIVEVEYLVTLDNLDIVVSLELV
jgi:hypothetical protein